MHAEWICPRTGRFPRALAATGFVALAVAFLPSAAMAEDPISKVKYACADDKSIEATYYPEEVELVLSDGRMMTLPQTMSGSGIRYANADESFVFWSKGNTAFATEGDPNHPTFADCVEETDG